MRLDQCRVEITPVLNEHYHRLYPISIRRTKSPVQYEILIFGLAPAKPKRGFLVLQHLWSRYRDRSDLCIFVSGQQFLN